MTALKPVTPFDILRRDFPLPRTERAHGREWHPTVDGLLDGFETPRVDDLLPNAMKAFAADAQAAIDHYRQEAHAVNASGRFSAIGAREKIERLRAEALASTAKLRDALIVQIEGVEKLNTVSVLEAKEYKPGSLATSDVAAEGYAARREIREAIRGLPEDDRARTLLRAALHGVRIVFSAIDSDPLSTALPIVSNEVMTYARKLFAAWHSTDSYLNLQAMMGAREEVRHAWEQIQIAFGLGEQVEADRKRRAAHRAGMPIGEQPDPLTPPQT